MGPSEPSPQASESGARCPGRSRCRGPIERRWPAAWRPGIVAGLAVVAGSGLAGPGIVAGLAVVAGSAVLAGPGIVAGLAVIAGPNGPALPGYQRSWCSVRFRLQNDVSRTPSPRNCAAPR